MSDRINALSVALADDVREEDAEKIASAIQQIKGVVSVKSNVKEVSYFVAESRVRNAIVSKLYNLINNDLLK